MPARVFSVNDRKISRLSPVEEDATEQDGQEADILAARWYAAAMERRTGATAPPRAFGMRLPLQMDTEALMKLVANWKDLAVGYVYLCGLEAMTKDKVTTAEAMAVHKVLKRLGRAVGDDAYRSGNDVRIWNRWAKHKIVYSVNPDLAEELADTDGMDSLPADALAMLPHPQPLFLLPRGIPMTHGDGAQGVARAFFVSGGWIDLAAGPGAQLISLSTTDPAANHLQINLLSQIGAPGEPVTDWDQASITLPLGGVSLSEAVDRVVERWDADHPADPVRLRSFIDVVVKHCLPVILYACTPDPDTEVRKPPPSARRKKAGGARDKGPVPTTIRLGYRLGPKLKAARTEQASGHPPAPTGRKLVKHTRRLHWHTYRVGPGRQERILKLLAPITVNDDGRDAELPTVIKVEGPGKP